jgi:hypothetical protein
VLRTINKIEWYIKATSERVVMEDLSETWGKVSKDNLKSEQVSKYINIFGNNCKQYMRKVKQNMEGGGEKKGESLVLDCWIGIKSIMMNF